ncbi:DUF1120 domain-containing protein [Pseudomonas sp. NPDC098747]|uniref:DUF1120 domain-containing protein n=1 Tax=Pseudomonas sp. NPDC098747 TaxID=3364487 RepID=UPI00383B616C
MKKLLLLPIALAFASNAAMAANSVDLRVIGTITPGACNISSSNGGEFAFGEIPFSSLNIDTSTVVDALQADLSIACSGPTQVAIRAMDNQAGTAMGSASSTSYGLGIDSQGAPIGYYTIMNDNAPLLDGSGVGIEHINSNDGGQAWTLLSNFSHMSHDGDLYSWSNGDTTPLHVTNVTHPLHLELTIAPTNSLDASSEITIAGSATLELVYL